MTDSTATFHQTPPEVHHGIHIRNAGLDRWEIVPALNRRQNHPIEAGEAGTFSAQHRAEEKKE